MGGPASYTDDHVRLVHARLGINAPSFERIIELLRETLEDFNIASRDVDELTSKKASKRHLIVATVAS